MGSNPACSKSNQQDSTELCVYNSDVVCGANDLGIESICSGDAETSTTETSRWINNGRTTNSCGNNGGATAAGADTSFSYTITSDSWIIIGGAFKAFTPSFHVRIRGGGSGSTPAVKVRGGIGTSISLVPGQTKTAFNTAVTTLNCVLPKNPQTGNFVVVEVNSGTTVTTVKDSNNNSYTATTNSPALNTSNAYIFYLANAPANASKTITITIPSQNTIECWAQEFFGVAASSPLETDAKHTSATSQTNINDPTVTTTNNGDLLVGVVVVGASVTSANSPWTDAGIQNGDDAEYYIQPTAGAQAISFTQNSAAQWSGMNAAFKAAKSVGVKFH